MATRAVALLVAAIPLQAAAGALANKADRAILAQSLAFREPQLTLMALAQPGSGRALERRLEALGASIQYADRDIGYLRFTVATAHVDAVAALPQVAALDFGMPLDRYSGTLQAADEEPGLAQKPGAAEQPATANEPDATASARRFDPADPARFPRAHMGVEQFLRDHPTFDGRGVVAAVVDGDVDILIPEMQHALTLDGRRTRKVLDVRTTSDPVDSENPSWVRLERAVAPQRGRFAVEGRQFTAPRAGSFRLGWFDERRCDIEDVNRDGNPPASSGLFAVLADAAAGSVWVDTNQDGSFADERELREYRERGDTGLFGVDRPQTPERDSVAFAVQFDRSRGAVFLVLLVGGHGTMTATTLAGAGPLRGMAPGTALVLYEVPEATIYPWVEAILDAERDPRVDLVCVSWGAYKQPIGADTLVSQAVDRAIRRHGKPVFSGAANSGPTLGIVAAPAISRLTFAIGAYTPAEAWLANQSIASDAEHGVPRYSARGPAHDGSLRPEFLALTEVLSGDSAHRPSSSPDAGLPPGYMVGSGTSQATPSAAGAFALLKSAARQRGVKLDVQRLRRALAQSAQHLDGYATIDQGNGVIRVDGAWDALRRMSDPRAAIEITGTVDAATGRALPIAGRGVGTWMREGWGTAASRRLELTATRVSGRAQPMEVSVRVRNDDGTFRPEVSRLTLPLQQPVSIGVVATPREPGLHDGILEILDASGALLAQSFLGVVRPLVLAAGETIAFAGAFGYPAGERQFVEVAAGTTALAVEVTCLDGEVVTRLRGPGGLEAATMDAEGRMLGERLVLEAGSALASFTYVVERPTPGVWEFNFNRSAPRAQPKRAASDRPNRYSVRTTALTHTVDLRVEQALVEVKVRSTSAVARTTPEVVLHRGVQRRERTTFNTAHRQHLIELDVPEGAAALVANVRRKGPPSQPDAQPAVDFDLYFVEAPAGVRIPKRAREMIAGWRVVRAIRAFDNGPVSTPQIVEHHPAPGRWVLVADRADDGNAPVEAEVSVALLHPLFGGGALAPLANEGMKASWTWNFGPALAVPALATPGDGYQAAAYLELRDAEWPLQPLKSSDSVDGGWRNIDGGRVAAAELRPVRVGLWDVSPSMTTQQ